MSKKRRIQLSDRLFVDIQFEWGGWDVVVDIYGKYDTSNIQEKSKLEWEDGVAVYKYLNDEGWIPESTEPLNILESFANWDMLNNSVEPVKQSIDEEESQWNDGYPDEPKDWE